MQSEELSQEERAEYCAIVVSNSEMLLTLLNDILDISSLECGKIRFNYASEDIVQICQHVMMTTAHTRQRGVEGRFACPVGSFMLTTDAHRLSQILINLLTNAGKFTSEGSITLGVEIDEEGRGAFSRWPTPDRAFRPTSRIWFSTASRSSTATRRRARGWALPSAARSP